jgi:hypothetical protein
MATLLKVLNNLADIKSAGGVALRVRTQAPQFSQGVSPVIKHVSIVWLQHKRSVVAR